MTIKDAEQTKAIEAWFPTKKGTLELTTGVGKTKVGLDVAAALALSKNDKGETARILLLTPTENLRDDHWQEEAEKWGYKFLFDDEIIKTACIQSAYKWIGLSYDLVICDEIHTMLTPEYSKFFTQNTLKRILGLSATIPTDKRLLLDTIAPIVYTINPSEAKEKSLISEYKIFNVNIEFTPEEKVQYDSSDANVTRAERELMSACNIDLNQVFDRARNAIKDFKEPSSVRMWASRYLQAVRTRVSICNNAINKAEAVTQILTKLNREKALVFSESIKFAEIIRKRGKGLGIKTYHSKMEHSVRKQVLAEFNDGDETKCLSTVRALDLGLNVERVSLGIIAAGSSSPLQFTQRLGRAVRKTSDDKVAIIVNLYIKNTKEERRISTRTSNEPVVQWVSLDTFLNQF